MGGDITLTITLGLVALALLLSIFVSIRRR